MKTSAFLCALLTFFTIIAIISLCLLEVVVMRHRNDEVSIVDSNNTNGLHYDDNMLIPSSVNILTINRVIGYTQVWHDESMMFRFHKDSATGKTRLNFRDCKFKFLNDTTLIIEPIRLNTSAWLQGGEITKETLKDK